MFSTRDRIFVAALVILWALLFLPHLRTNPNWYGDEGFWMETSWTLAHGHASNGALNVDFLFPYPYPPLYLALNGAMLRIFGNDIVVGRLLQAVTALAAAAILFWIGTRLRNKMFGYLCAAAFLVYPEVVINFRWVRSHPMAGTLALASVGFLIRYIQDKHLRDIVWAGVFCSLATATSYWTYGLIAAVIVTALLVNWRHLPVAAASACTFLGVFFLTYIAAYPDGLVKLLIHMRLLTFMSSLEGNPASSWIGEVARMGRSIFQFCFLTPVSSVNGIKSVDIWLMAATAGLFFVPAPRFRKWLFFWLLTLMFAVFKGTNNASTYLYRAMTFVPLMAVGYAAAVEQLGICVARWVPAQRAKWLSPLSAALLLGVFGCISLTGSMGHFRTKIDGLTLHSVTDAESVVSFINDHTTMDDLVLIPSQLYWMVQKPRRTQLVDSLNYEGQITGVWPVVFPQDVFRFACPWRDAKYLVLAAGTDANGKPCGVDAVFTMQFAAVQETMKAMKGEHWTVALQNNSYLVLANPRFPVPANQARSVPVTNLAQQK